MKLKPVALAVLLLSVIGCHKGRRFDIETMVLKQGYVGQAYADTIRTSHGQWEVDVYLLSGQLPPGVALRSHDESGVLYGVPQFAGDYLFTVEASSGNGSDGDHPTFVSRGFLITIRP